ncbi:uncharacterized protein EAF01_002231 [Botrytis porri]|uniref:uncharacterized protein n=1 Tax=Botrytis porri TaxID=87229 RepID=UPI0018FF58F2|nr:uncharacterized protein EAF01_002231 [Botrytis porri]KAF7910722.1 hypothetical protein EAF01_002231 [Botrytis porri]
MKPEGRDEVPRRTANTISRKRNVPSAMLYMLQMDERSDDHDARGIPLNHDDFDNEDCLPLDLDEAEEEEHSAILAPQNSSDPRSYHPHFSRHHGRHFNLHYLSCD